MKMNDPRKKEWSWRTEGKLKKVVLMGVEYEPCEANGKTCGCCDLRKFVYNEECNSCFNGSMCVFLLGFNKFFKRKGT